MLKTIGLVLEGQLHFSHASSASQLVQHSSYAVSQLHVWPERCSRVNPVIGYERIFAVHNVHCIHFVNSHVLSLTRHEYYSAQATIYGIH